VSAQEYRFGGPRTCPPREGAKYAVPPVTIDDLRRMHRALGIERGLIA
jgi:hypothetical protein